MRKGLKTLVATIALLTFGAGSAIAHGYNDLSSFFVKSKPGSPEQSTYRLVTPKELNLAVSNLPWGPVAVFSDRTFVKGDGSVVEFDYGVKGSLDGVVVNSASGIVTYTGDAITQSQNKSGEDVRSGYLKKEVDTILSAFEKNANLLRFYDPFESPSSVNEQNKANIGRAIFGYNGKTYSFVKSKVNGEASFSVVVSESYLNGAVESKYIDLQNIKQGSPEYSLLDSFTGKINADQAANFPAMPVF